MMDATRHWGQACRMTHKERRNRSPRIMPKRQTEGEREKKKERTFVSRTVLEQYHLTLLEVKACLLRQEQVRTLHDVLEVRFALAVDQGSHVRDVHCFRPGRHKEQKSVRKGTILMNGEQCMRKKKREKKVSECD